MPDHTIKVLERLADYAIDGDLEALSDACAMAVAQPADMAALLSGLNTLVARRADPTRLQQARTRLRAALHLPLIPGPACRVAS